MKACIVGACVLAVIAAWPSAARGDLCPKCKGMAYTADVGTCAECGGHTSSGALKLCKACSAKLHQCEHCRAALGGAPVARDANSAARDANSAASQPAPEATKSLVPGRMVCCEACKAKLDLANGVKKCPTCGQMCNVAHKMCTKCAAGAGVCEVCGKTMAGPATGPAQTKPAETQAALGELVITEDSAGKTVEAAVGQKVVIRIPSEGPGPRPPPQWTARLDGNSLRQEGLVRLRAKTPPIRPGPPGIVGVVQGGPMVAEATFTAAKPGKTTVTLEARPYNQADAAPSKTFTVTVDVKAGEPASKPS